MQIVFPVSQLKLSFIVPGRYSLDDSGHGEPGIGFRLPNGSVLYEHALMEDHATTALPSPSRLEPNRLALVYYQVRKLIGLAKQDWNHSGRLATCLGVDSQTLATKAKIVRMEKREKLQRVDFFSPQEMEGVGLEVRRKKKEPISAFLSPSVCTPYLVPFLLYL